MNNKKIRIEIEDSHEFFVIIRGFEDSSHIGDVKLSRNGAVVKIADIQVVDIKLPIFPFFLFIKKRLSYKGKGYGSQLLDATIEYCKSQNVERIEGMVAGDMDFLVSWYKRHGFKISNGNIITMELH